MTEQKENIVEIFYKDVLRTWHQDGDTKRELEHLYCGLLDEIGELASAYKKNVGYGKDLDLVNVKEELGDIFYFLVLATKYQTNGGAFQKKMLDIINSDKFSNKQKLSADLFSEITVAFSQLNNDNSNILLLFVIFTEVCYNYNFTFDEVVISNMQKREIRYPGGYTQDRATNRDLSSERESLEK